MLDVSHQILKIAHLSQSMTKKKNLAYIDSLMFQE